jgi:hypothetical protein
VRRYIAITAFLAGLAPPLLGTAAAPRPSASTQEAELKGLDVEVIPGDKVADPFLGDWQGQWAEGWPRDLVAQVICRGAGNYQINFLPAFDQRCPPTAVVQSKAAGKTLRFEQDGWSGQIDGNQLKGTGLFNGKPVAFELAKTTRLSHRLGAKPPPGAIVLFDTNGLRQWEPDGRGGIQEIQWQQIDDYLRTWPPLPAHAFGPSIRARKVFPDFQLHLEFRLPLIAAATGQRRANSGVIIDEFEFYEVQILDSYGLVGYWDDCGAIYTKEAPKVNMCAPPGQWQSYDIEYHAPKFDGSGKLLSKARITVDLNGKLIHKDVDLPYSDKALEARRQKPDSRKPGRITLQHHGDPVDFRNVWLKPLSENG